jgi:protein-ribulosamine 3-kinase
VSINIQGLPFFSKLNIIGIEPGGTSSFFHTFKVNTASEQYFVKITDQNRFKDILEYEYKGLYVLASVIPNSVPKVFEYGQCVNNRFLITRYISSGKSVQQSLDFTKAARQLALIHSQKSKFFGLEYSNAIGSLIQINTPNSNWSDFFIKCRLIPQLELLKGSTNNQYIELINLIENLIKRVPDLISNCVPSLLHGDLWNGNLLFNDQGDPIFIDPAISYGHSEVDLAMTLLFGRFLPRFYQTYFEICPKECGYEDRITLYQIYYLLVHVNIFGLSYHVQTKNAIKKLL